MKKAAVLFLTLLCVLSFASCDRKITYELPNDQFCYTSGKERVEFDLNQEDKEFIISLLNNSSWIDDQTACASNFVFYTQKQEIHYCGRCGKEVWLPDGAVYCGRLSCHPESRGPV